MWRDADWAVHEYSGVHGDGTGWQTIKKWFGYTLHLVVDATYELPVGFKVTKASRSEMPVAHEIVDELAAEHGQMVEGCEYLGGAVRISLDEDRRIFTPLARSSYSWKRIYFKRSAVERVNSRLDGAFSLERHFIRGVGKDAIQMFSLAICNVGLSGRQNQAEATGIDEESFKGRVENRKRAKRMTHCNSFLGAEHTTANGSESSRLK